MKETEKNIVIIDFNTGNLASIQNIIKKAGHRSKVSNTPEDINQSTHLILPGVGNFKFGMEQLQKLNIIPIIEKKIFNTKTPLLGVCLGMQLLTESSEEGDCKGLNWIKNTRTILIKPDSKNIKVPHMGWNDITPQKKHPIFNNLNDSRFYFVHSYKVVCDNEKSILTTTNYPLPFVSGIVQDNIIGLQFHPEKSHKFGLQLIKNFISLSS